MRSSPKCLSLAWSLLVWEEWWKALRVGTNCVGSLAALTVRVEGITKRVWAKAAMASCSRELWGGNMINLSLKF